jgi:hypothetical protein
VSGARNDRAQGDRARRDHSALGLLVLGALAALAGCGPEDFPLVGLWQNGSGQQLALGPGQVGTLTQTATCAPNLAVAAVRDPFGGWSIDFDDDQRIFYPPSIAADFTGEAYCASSGTKPMCAFCRRAEDRLDCEPTEQEIIGQGKSVTHDCSFRFVSTATVVKRTWPRQCTAVDRDPRCNRPGT